MDYTNLNDAYPKATFPLPHIDHIVDAMADHKLSSFQRLLELKQIMMYPPDEPKISSITPYDMYCYKVMSFGLKNAIASYKLMMSRVFASLLGIIVEACVNDILVKSM